MGEKSCLKCYYWGEHSKQCLVDDMNHEISQACREHGFFHFQPRPEVEKPEDDYDDIRIREKLEERE